MTATLFGIACGEESSGDVAAYYRYGRLAEAHTFKTLDTRLLPSGTPVTVGHNHADRIGLVVHAELGTDARLGVVAVVDEDVEVLDRVGQLYWSPELVLVGSGLNQRAVSATRAGITSVGITTTPATLAAVPLRWVAGDIRRRGDRNRWPLGWAGQHPLLQRCVSHLGTGHDAEHRHATRILDRRDEADREMRTRLARQPLMYSSGGSVISVR